MTNDLPSKVELVTEVDDGVSDDETPTSDHDHHSKRHKVHLLASKAKRKVKRLPVVVLNKTDNSGAASDEDGGLFDDPAFNPAIVLDGNPPKRLPTRNGDEGRLKQLGHAIIHPRQAAREKATRVTATQISNSQRPYLSAQEDIELLKADEALSQATSKAETANVDGAAAETNEVREARARLQDIQSKRESAKTAWAIGRHVSRVKVVQLPRRRPRRDEFVVIDHQRGQRFEWEKWLGHLALWYTRNFTARYVDDFGERPPFDIHELARIVERLALISAPWQAFLVDVRAIYTWQDKKRTARWCALYWFLWYTHHLVGFVYFYIIYLTLRNKFYPSSIKSIRTQMERSVDHQAQAQAWGELIEKHGRSDWVEPMIIELGPLIQLQLGDFANLIEVVTNFYRWERPSKTAASLFWWSCCLAVTLLADMRFCMKVVSFIVGGGFFFTFPIGTRYPQYRVLMDYLRWIFWDIPTHAELGFIQLQEKAILEDAKGLEEATQFGSGEYDTESSDAGYDTASSHIKPSTPARRLVFKAYREKSKGRLFLTRHELRFCTHSETVQFPLTSIVEMRKVPTPYKRDQLVKFQKAAEGLEFDFRAAPEQNVQTLSLKVQNQDRQKIFNRVLAWSDQKWQSLQVKRLPTFEESKKEIDKVVKHALN